MQAPARLRPASAWTLYLKLPFFRGFQAINLDYSREKDGFTEKEENKEDIDIITPKF